MMSSHSDYLYSLDESVQARYLEKISLINNIDPFVIAIDKKSFTTDIKNYPQITYIDIYNYLILKKSAYTQTEFRAYKSLDAYKFFKCGWVKEIQTKTFGTNVLVMGKVLHSQRLNESPLQAWFVAKQEGEILCAHCKCVAGLGETCSHVAALMFYIDDIVRNVEPVTVTGEKSYWLPPSSSKKIKTMAAAVEMDFSTNKSKHEVLHEIQTIALSEESRTYSELKNEEMMQFLQTLYDNKVDASILTVTAPFCMENAENIPQNIENKRLELDFFEEHYLTGTREDLLQNASKIQICLTKEDCEFVEQNTKGQATNKFWFKCRKGRITASIFKNACRTSLEKPSVSLIKRICYPEERKFTTAATKYGCDHEKDALNAYHAVASKKHENLILNEVGLMLNPMYPMFGASPDSFLECECCGKGVIEIKCPLCTKDIAIEEALSIKKLCISKNKSGQVSLDKNHLYYYQIQMQLAICQRNFCDFVIWSKKDMYVERIYFNEEFWNEESEKAKLFFSNVIMLELLGKYYTR